MCIRAIIAVLAVSAAMTAPAVAQQKNSALLGMTSENEARAWQAVGRLDAEDIGFCTGTLITSEFVLTAAHCVYSSETGAPIAPDDMVFRAGLRQGNVVAERAISQIEAHSRYRADTGHSLENIRHDVALLRLAQPISTVELNPLVVHDKEVMAGSVSVVSYGRNREDLPSRQDTCQIKGAVKGIMVMSCRVTFGSSGAPVMREVNGHGQIVSVISGGGQLQGERVSYGMVLPELVADLKHQMWLNRAQPVATINRVRVGAGTFGASSGGAKFVRP